MPAIELFSAAGSELARKQDKGLARKQDKEYPERAWFDQDKKSTLCKIEREVKLVNMEVDLEESPLLVRISQQLDAVLDRQKRQDAVVEKRLEVVSVCTCSCPGTVGYVNSIGASSGKEHRTTYTHQGRPHRCYFVHIFF